MTTREEDLEAIRQALYSGQKSAVKTKAQEAFERLVESLKAPALRTAKTLQEYELQRCVPNDDLTRVRVMLHRAGFPCETRTNNEPEDSPIVLVLHKPGQGDIWFGFNTSGQLIDIGCFW